MIASKPQHLREMPGTDPPSHSSEGPNSAATLILNPWPWLLSLCYLL